MKTKEKYSILLKSRILQKIGVILKKYKIPFILIFVPVIVMNFYSILIQSPRYESYATISIEQNKQGIASIMSASILGGLAGSGDAVPSQTAIDYIRSIDMYHKLDQQIMLSKILKSHKIDFISRLRSRPDQKEVLDYYQSLLSTFYNSQSQTIELKFQGFSPKESQQILGQIILNVQIFVNGLDQQLTTQRINFGQKQALIAHKKLSEAEAQIIAFQNNKDILDPKTETGVIVGILATLQSQLVVAQTDLVDKGAYYQQDSMEIQQIQQRIDSLKMQINLQKQKLLGLSGTAGNDEKLNRLLAQFEEISMQAKVAGAEYAASIQGLEMAKTDAIQQKQQVVIVQPPVLPDYHKYPRVGYNTMIMFIILTMLYGVVRMFIRIISEHNY